jgi:hypothetical protein
MLSNTPNFKKGRKVQKLRMLFREETSERAWRLTVLRLGLGLALAAHQAPEEVDTITKCGRRRHFFVVDNFSTPAPPAPQKWVTLTV